jgi:hypothetical protein
MLSASLWSLECDILEQAVDIEENDEFRVDETREHDNLEVRERAGPEVSISLRRNELGVLLTIIDPIDLTILEVFVDIIVLDSAGYDLEVSLVVLGLRTSSMQLGDTALDSKPFEDVRK